MATKNTTVQITNENNNKAVQFNNTKNLRATDSNDDKIQSDNETLLSNCGSRSFSNYLKKNNTTISNLNHEMSATLRNSITQLDDICVRVRNCLEEITQNNRRYEMLKKLPDIELPDNLEEITSRISLRSSILLNLEEESDSTIHDITSDDRMEEKEKIIDVKSDVNVSKEAQSTDKLPKDNGDKAKNSQHRRHRQQNNEDFFQSAPVEPNNEIRREELPAKRQNVYDPKRIEMKLKYLKRAVAQIPSSNKKERLLRLLSYNSLTNKARIDLVDHLKRRISHTTLQSLKTTKQNVIALPKKRTSSKRFLVDERFSDSLFFSHGRSSSNHNVNNNNKRVKKSVTETKLTKSTKSLPRPSKTVDDTNSNKLKKVNTNVNLNNSNNNDSDDNNSNQRDDAVQQRPVPVMRKAPTETLDTIRQEDLEPFTSEYPRRDNIYYEELKNFRNTFLYKIASSQNDRMMKFLFATPEGTRARRKESKENWNEYSQQRRRRKEAILAKLRPLLTEMKTNKQKKKIKETSTSLDLSLPKNNKSKNNKRPSSSYENRSSSLVSFMIDPNVNHFKTYTVMPVQITYDNNNNNLRKRLDGNVSTTSSKHYQMTNNIAINKYAKPKVNTHWDANSFLNNNNSTRKLHHKQLMSNKYKKTTSENLINYVYHQKPLYDYLQRNEPKEVPTKQLPTYNNSNGNNIEKFNPALYKNNRYLSQDISRIVGAIEEKIIKVIADPNENHKAFNDIEQEIKDVLTVMQRLKDDTNINKGRITFDLPTLISEDNSEKSDLNLTVQKSNVSFKTGNSNVSLLHSSPDLNLPIEASTKAEEYCNKILKEIADTKEQLRMIQKEEYLTELEETKNVDVDEEHKDDVTIVMDKREVLNDEDDETDISKVNVEQNVKETEQDVDNIDDVLLKIEEFNFKESDIDFKNSTILYIDSDVNENAKATDNAQNRLLVEERTLKNTINERIKEMNNKMEEIARTKEFNKEDVNRRDIGDYEHVEEQVDEENDKYEECLEDVNCCEEVESNEKIENNKELENERDVKSNKEVKSRRDVKNKKGVKSKSVVNITEESLRNTSRSLKQRQINNRTRWDYVIPNKKQKLTKTVKKMTLNGRRARKYENDRRRDGPTIVKSTTRFLTPYFQAIKQYRNKLESSSTQNILAFLDKLTDIASSNKRIIREKRYVLERAIVMHVTTVEGFRVDEWQAQYQFRSNNWDDVDYYMSVTEAESYKPPEILSPIEGIKLLVDNLKALQPFKETLSSDSTSNNSITKRKKSQPKNKRKQTNDSMANKKCVVEKESIAPNLLSKSSEDQKKPKTKAKNTKNIKNANDEEYSCVLGAVYGIVFLVMYAGLQMNFTCNNTN